MSFKLPSRSYSGNPVVLTVAAWSDTSTYSVGSYDHVYVCVSVAERESVAATLAGTIGNAAGYGTDEAAARIGAECARLIRAGIVDTYTTTGYQSLTMRWQRYDATSYCGSPRLQSMDGPARDIERALDLYRHVERLTDKVGGGMGDPRDVIGALVKAKAVPLFDWRERKARFGEYSGSGGWVAATPADLYGCLPVPARDTRAAG